MPTWILKLEEGCGPLRVAVKDLLDVAGTPTTAGSAAVARRAAPAGTDAACLRGLRQAMAAGRARLVGKTNLHELAAGATGVNPWFGTPVNPLGADLVPGGSSSGSAVAVAAGEADIAIGTDTAGSVRIPAACCGVVGLKTTWGRIPLDGVWPLAPSLDTVGPMGRDVAAVAAGMALLEPGFRPAAGPDAVGRLRLDAPAWIDEAVDAAIARAELTVAPVAVPGWAAATDATFIVVGAEAWAADGPLLRSGEVAADLVEALSTASAIPPLVVDGARRDLRAWQATLIALIDRHGPLVAPTLVTAVPTVAAGDPGGRLLRATAAVNGAGLPSLALPVRGPAGRPVGLQVIGAPGQEEHLVGLGLRIEAALAG